MDRRIVKIVPGSYIAWTAADGTVEGSTAKAQMFEVPPGGNFIGSWAEKPDSNEIMEYKEMGVGLN